MTTDRNALLSRLNMTVPSDLGFWYAKPNYDQMLSEMISLFRWHKSVPNPAILAGVSEYIYWEDVVLNLTEKGTMIQLGR